jgi:hypothetical protein
MAGSADWSIGVGVLIFIIAICFAVYFYLKYKKMYQTVFIASISTYIFAVFYAMDVFELSKNGVLGLLVISTILMMGVGKYFGNVSKTSSKNSSKKLK